METLLAWPYAAPLKFLMSIATAIVAHTKDVKLAKRRRFNLLKVALAVSAVLALMYAGLQGRQHARLQARVQAISLVRDRLQQKLDEQTSTEQFVGTVHGTTTEASHRPSADEQIKSLISTLNIRLGQFDSDYGPDRLGEVEGLDVRLSKATLANAERRFAGALTIVTERDQKAQHLGREAQNDRLMSVLQVRGDSFYGLHELQQALDCYQQILILHPDRVATLALVANCEYGIGRVTEALSTYDTLAKRQNNQANAFLVDGKPDAAVVRYQNAIEIQAWLIEKNGQRQLANELAKSHCNRGNAFLVLGKPDAAIAQFEKAIEIQVRLVEKEGRTELAFDLAISHSRLGSALLSQQKLDAVITLYSTAIQTEARLIEQEPRSELANDLAMTYNNRGVVRRVQGKLDAAIEDFDSAIKFLTPRIEEEQRLSEPAIIHDNRGNVRYAEFKLDVLLEYYEKALDVQTQPRFVQEAGRTALAGTLAMSFKNRGYAQVVQGKRDAAIADFNRAREIYTRLLEQEGRSDTALQSTLSRLDSTLEVCKSGSP